MGGDTTLAPHRTGWAAEHNALLVACVVLVGMLALNPLASLAGSALLLINLPAATPRRVRLALGTVLVLSLALLTGSRPIDADGSSDIEGYFAVYRRLADGDLTALFHFGGGFEIALPLLMLLLAWVLPPLTINGLMFCTSLTASMLVMLWLEHAYYRLDQSRRPNLLGIVLVMLNLYFATQLVRQVLSLVVLLFAFSAQARPRQVLYLTLAAAFHVSAIPFYAVFLLARRGWPGWVAIIACALVLRVFFARILVAIDVIPEVAAEKLVYYLDNLEESTESDLTSLRMIYLLGAISLLASFAHRFRPPASVIPWIAVPWVAGVVHLLLLPIPLASLRTTLIVHSILPGLVAFMMLPSRAGSLRSIVFNVLLVYKVAGYTLASQAANLRPSLTMIGTLFQ